MRDKIIYLNNGILKVGVNLYGGAFYSVCDLRTGEELMWQGQAPWNSRDIVLFPLVARQKDGYYLHAGKRYEADIHGFAKDSVFSLESNSGEEAILLLESSPETLKAYPFSFRLRLLYSIKENTVGLKYSVENVGAETMSFMLGGHIGMALDGDSDTKGNVFSFSPPVSRVYPLDGNFILPAADCSPIKSFEADKEFFRKNNTLLTVGGGATEVTLRRSCGREIVFNADSPVIAFWSNPGGGTFACVEPWWGVPDASEPVRELKDKELVNALESGGIFTCGYSFTVK